MKKATDKDVCSKCGYLWIEHEFAVPEPYCPTNDEDAKSNRGSSARFKKIVNDIQKGIWVDPLNRDKTQFVIQNKGFTDGIWFDFETSLRSYDEAKEFLSKLRKDLTYRIIKRVIVETVIN
jgi:hypothetical protein